MVGYRVKAAKVISLAVVVDERRGRRLLEGGICSSLGSPYPVSGSPGPLPIPGIALSSSGADASSHLPRSD